MQRIPRGQLHQGARPKCSPATCTSTSSPRARNRHGCGVNTVRFAPCARTAWHTHACGQTLHVTDGIGLVQSRGGEVVVMRPGDTVYTPPGEWHWHGAAPTHFMTHLAMWEAPDPASGQAETEWGEHVTDDEYRVPEGVQL